MLRVGPNNRPAAEQHRTEHTRLHPVSEPRHGDSPNTRSSVGLIFHRSASSADGLLSLRVNASLSDVATDTWPLTLAKAEHTITVRTHTRLEQVDRISDAQPNSNTARCRPSANARRRSLDDRYCLA